MIAILALALIPAAALAADPIDTIRRVKASIVAVGTFEKTRSPTFAFSGTGFAVGDGRLIATNAHVLPKSLDGERRESLAVAVATSPGQILVHLARVVAVDALNDIATLEVEGATLPGLPLGDSARLREGQQLYFTGFPIGSVLGVIPVTHRAMVSALTPLAIPQIDSSQLDARAIKRLSGQVLQVIQLDAIAYPGSSGSPLYDPQTGEVVGIVNAVFVKSGRESALTSPSGITYAIPSSVLSNVLSRQK